MKQWRMVIELTYDIEAEDVELKFEGDSEVDFARRGLERVRNALGQLLTPEGGPFAHYHILELPERVEE